MALRVSRDWAAGQPIVFSHGWPLTADAWDDADGLLRLARLPRASRTIAAATADQASRGTATTMDTYADDLATLVEALDLKRRDPRRPLDRRRRGGPLHRPPRHGRGSPRRSCIGAVPPLMLKTPANPSGLPIEVFDGIRAGVDSRSLAVLQGPQRAVLRRQPGRRQGLAGGARRVLAAGHAGRPQDALDCIKAFSETDFTEDLEEVRRADADHARRRRPDRADRRLGAADRRSWSRMPCSRSTRAVAHGLCTHQRRPGQRRPAGLLQR